ncbi:MAG TPA: helix-turn-helix domain-containing protein [Gemmatimonadaceae bacterium]|nr:helix-turn-helix domain-containing protein [Gemmatimonadaceae bacterium]
MNSIRERLLDAAARVYAETGYRGATTRRIAQEAGVNEITLFRHFGSKTTLILEAVRQANLRSDCATVPASPGEPVSEIKTWVRDELRHLTQLRSIIRTSLGEVEERPEILPLIGKKPRDVILGLSAYVEQLQAQGRALGDVDARTAALMFFGTLFADAMGRDVMPELYHDSLEESADRYAALFLRAIGAAEGTNGGNPTRAEGQGPRAKGRARGRPLLPAP